MDPRLKRIADDAESRDWRKTREYAAILAEKSYPQRLFDAAPQVEKLLASNQKLAAKVTKDYPLAGNENRPPYLRDAIADLHSHYLRPLRDRFALLPQRMRDKAQRIKDAKPADFRFYAPQLLAKLDGEQCDSLMSELLWLEQFPERLAGQEAFILEWLNSPTGGGSQTPPPPAPEFVTAPQPDDEGKTFSDFDPRR